MVSHEQIILHGFARTIIRRKARSISYHDGFTAEDRFDLEQELRLRLNESLPQYDAAQGHINVFITTVIERAAISIIRERGAQKRDDTGTQSLETPAVSAERRDVCKPLDPRSRNRGIVRRDLALDLEELLAALPEELRALVLQLKERSLRQIAKERNIPRTSLYRQIRELRSAFEKAGLEIYC